MDIHLTRNKVAIVSDIDSDLAHKRWYCMVTGYAARSEKVNGIRREIYMHRVILERILGRPLREDEVTDHINRNVLDNQRSNLRVATPSQSVHNTKQKGGTSQYKGVHRRGNRWAARIMAHRVQKMIGLFATQEEAARAYDYEAIRLHGEFAALNYPDERDRTVEWGCSFFNHPQPAIRFINNTSGYRGVYRINKRWAARIGHNKSNHFLGYFDTPEEAARAYDRAAKQLKGSKARINLD